MPLLRHCLPSACWEQQEVRPLLDLEVVAIKLNDAAACGRESGLFTPWPGADQNVGRWFELADGTAVGLVEEPDAAPRCQVADAFGPATSGR